MTRQLPPEIWKIILEWKTKTHRLEQMVFAGKPVGVCEIFRYDTLVRIYFYKGTRTVKIICKRTYRQYVSYVEFPYKAKPKYWEETVINSTDLYWSENAFIRERRIADWVESEYEKHVQPIAQHYLWNALPKTREDWGEVLAKNYKSLK